MSKRKHDLPVGFSMALAQNPDAMESFSALTETERESYIARAKTVTSKEDMDGLIAMIKRGTES